MAKSMEEILSMLVVATTEATEAATRNALLAKRHTRAIYAIVRRLLRLEAEVGRVRREITRN